MSYVLGPSVLSAGVHTQSIGPAPSTSDSTTITDTMAAAGRVIVCQMINTGGLAVAGVDALNIKTITDNISFVVDGYSLGNPTDAPLDYYISYIIMEATT